MPNEEDFEGFDVPIQNVFAGRDINVEHKSVYARGTKDRIIDALHDGSANIVSKTPIPGGRRRVRVVLEMEE